MAWNIPGGGKDGRKSPQRRRRSVDRWLAPLRGLFGNGGVGGGNIARWLGIAAGMWLVFQTFVRAGHRAAARRCPPLRPVLARVAARPALQVAMAVEPRSRSTPPRARPSTTPCPCSPATATWSASRSTCKYRISDPKAYLFGTRDARKVLEQATLSSVREQVGRSDLDTVLVGARSVVTDAVNKRCRPRWIPTAPA